MKDMHGVEVGDRDLRATEFTPRNVEAFSALIHQEKSRSDRSGESFSLLVVDTGSDGGVAMARSVAAAMTQNARCIDQIGWLDSARIGVVLPSTTFDGASKLAERILEEKSLVGRRPVYGVYEYPWDLLPLGAGDTAEVEESHENYAVTPGLPSYFCLPMPRWKRALDVVGSLLIVLVIWPLLFATAVYINVVSPGPVFYKQRRVGYGGRAFTFVKFRTMKVGNNEQFHRQHIVAKLRANQPLAKLDDKGDPRIIRGGRVIRRACIDELPQLINVLRGEMSLVGPRPCLPYEAAELLRWHGQRFEVVPGITGLWQVSGKNKLSLQEMIRLDISYAHNMSLWLDLWILLRTVPAIIVMVGESIMKWLRHGTVGVHTRRQLPGQGYGHDNTEAH